MQNKVDKLTREDYTLSKKLELDGVYKQNADSVMEYIKDVFSQIRKLSEQEEYKMDLLCNKVEFIVVVAKNKHVYPVMLTNGVVLYDKDSVNSENLKIIKSMSKTQIKRIFSVRDIKGELVIRNRYMNVTQLLYKEASGLLTYMVIDGKNKKTTVTRADTDVMIGLKAKDKFACLILKHLNVLKTEGRDTNITKTDVEILPIFA